MTAIAAGQERPATGMSNTLLGVVLFIVSEAMFFLGLILAYVYIRAQSVSWPPPGSPHLEVIPLPTVNTILLMLSGATMHWARSSIQKGKRGGLIAYVLVTMLLGSLFLAGQAYEYTHVGFSPQDGALGTTFFVLTGFHGAHVFGGLAFLLVVLLRALLGQFPREYHLAVEGCALYWHFVDVVWVFLFALLYLL